MDQIGNHRTWVHRQGAIRFNGEFGRVEKGEVVLAAGAGGYVLANDPASGDSLVGDAHALPAVHISNADGVVLLAWMASGADHMAAIGGRQLSELESNGDVMSASSSRGPNQADADILQPSVGAPGTDIIAAYGSGGEVIWEFLSGTSMASPHVAGSGLLLASAHPDWTPTMIASAVTMTATPELAIDYDGTEATPFKRGSGRPRLDQAANSGLYLNETQGGFLAADPGLGGDPRDLNLPGLVDTACRNNCAFQRTVTDLAGGATWSASTMRSMTRSASSHEAMRGSLVRAVGGQLVL